VRRDGRQDLSKSWHRGTPLRSIALAILYTEVRDDAATKMRLFGDIKSR
jgi:hypothetical protein